jgi:hypothetical protein
VGGLGWSDIVRPALAWLCHSKVFSGAGKTSPPTRSTAQHVPLPGECGGASLRRAKKAPKKQLNFALLTENNSPDLFNRPAKKPEIERDTLFRMMFFLFRSVTALLAFI